MTRRNQAVAMGPDQAVEPTSPAGIRRGGAFGEGSGEAFGEVRVVP